MAIDLFESQPESGGVDLFADTQSKKKQNKGIASDLVTDIKRGVEQIPGIATGIADIPIAAITGKAYADKATDALGGISNGGSAIWKRWKKDYPKYAEMKFSDLSEDDQLECKFEIIDMLHFFMNYAASIGMTPQEMYNMYMSKNEENRARQKRGY